MVSDTPAETPESDSAPKQSDSVDDVLNTIPDLTTDSADADASGTEEQFSLDAINDDDLADVAVLEELAPPKRHINKQAIAEAREKFKIHETDSGSPEYQIASLTTRIQYLTSHLKTHPKDYASTRGLLKMVSTRTRLLKYLRRENPDRFDNIIAGLNIRISQKLRRLGE